jgi:hypothetical protein
MEIKQVTIFIADCGKKYWSRSGCKAHEKVCKCWTNPKHKTCLTCAFSANYSDCEGEQSFHSGGVFCNSPEFEYDKHFTPAHENASDLCINCPLWQSSNSDVNINTRLINPISPKHSPIF